MDDLAVFGQDPGYAGGEIAKAEQFRDAAVAVGRIPSLYYLRHRRLDAARRGSSLHGQGIPPVVPALNVLNQLVAGIVAARRARGARTRFVVVSTASSGCGALFTRSPYGCWISTTHAEEGPAHRGGLDRPRRIAHRLSAPGLQLLERVTLRRASVRWTISPDARRAAARDSGLPEAAFQVVAIPIDTDRFTPMPDDEWQRGLDAPELVFVGRADDPRKNIELLLEGFARLRTRLPEATLTLVGRAPARDLPDGVTALGLVPSVADVIRRTQLFVLPSLQEGFGIVVAEALASGVPVLVTPCGGPEELVRASQGGEVLSGFEPQELADRAFAVLQDRGRLMEMRRLGRAHVVREHHPLVLQTALTEALEVLDRDR